MQSTKPMWGWEGSKARMGIIARSFSRVRQDSKAMKGSKAKNGS